MVGLVTQNAVGISLDSPLRERLEKLTQIAIEATQTDEGEVSPELEEFADRISAVVESWNEGEEEEEGEGGGEEWERVEVSEEEGEEQEQEQGEEEEEEEEGQQEEEEEGGERDEDEDGATVLRGSGPSAHVAMALSEAYNTIPETEGSGLYPAVALINHSCDPNVSLEFLDGTTLASVVALCDIPAGKEVCHCYVEQEALPTREERANALSQYGFACGCEACAPHKKRGGGGEGGASKRAKR